MKKYPEVYKKQTHSFEEDYATLDIASATDCTGMVPRPPLNDVEAENFADILSMPQQSAGNAKALEQTEKQNSR